MIQTQITIKLLSWRKFAPYLWKLFNTVSMIAQQNKEKSEKLFLPAMKRIKFTCKLSGMNFSILTISSILQNFSNSSLDKFCMFWGKKSFTDRESAEIFWTIEIIQICSRAALFLFQVLEFLLMRCGPVVVVRQKLLRHSLLSFLISVFLKNSSRIFNSYLKLFKQLNQETQRE